MKQFLTFFMIIILLTQVGCASVQSSKSVGVRDASSFEKAVIVSSIGEEYGWVKKNYPGSRIEQQALVFQRKKPFDILTFTLSDGTKREFYFDISKFYGKIF